MIAKTGFTGGVKEFIQKLLSDDKFHFKTEVCHLSTLPCDSCPSDSYYLVVLHWVTSVCLSVCLSVLFIH